MDKSTREVENDVLLLGQTGEMARYANQPPLAIIFLVSWLCVMFMWMMGWLPILDRVADYLISRRMKIDEERQKSIREMSSRVESFDIIEHQDQYECTARVAIGKGQYRRELNVRRQIGGAWYSSDDDSRLPRQESEAIEEARDLNHLAVMSQWKTSEASRVAVKSELPQQEQGKGT